MRTLVPCFLVLLFCGSGCAGLDRDSYSLFFRKPAHQYRTLSEWEKEELERYEATRINPSEGFKSSVAYQGFRPFRYCHRHQSYHVAESIGAIALAPVEVPVSVGTYMGGIGVRGIAYIGQNFARGADWLWRQVTGNPRPAPTPNREKPEERARR